MPILQKYLDLKPVRWDELTPQDRWEDEIKSDIELERQRDTKSKDARKRCNRTPAKNVKQ